MMKFISYVRGLAYYTISIAPVIYAIDHGVACVAYVEGRSMTPTLNGSDPTIYKDLGFMRMQSKLKKFPETNEILLIRKLFHHPMRGEVVVLDIPGKPGQRAVKRVIAMEGDIIMYYVPGRRKSLTTLQSEVDTAQKLEELAEAMRQHTDMQEIISDLSQHLKKEEQYMDSLLESDDTHNKDGDANMSKLKFKFLKSKEVNPEDVEFKFEDAEIRLVRIPTGHCWVEGDNPRFSRDSRDYGPVPLGMVRGGVVGVCWPPRLFGSIRSHKSATTNILNQVVKNKVMNQNVVTFQLSSMFNYNVF